MDYVPGVSAWLSWVGFLQWQILGQGFEHNLVYLGDDSRKPPQGVGRGDSKGKEGMKEHSVAGFC